MNESKQDRNKKRQRKLFEAAKKFHQGQEVWYKNSVCFIGDDLLYVNEKTIRWDQVKFIEQDLADKTVTVYVTSDWRVRIYFKENFMDWFFVCLHKWSKAMNKQHEVSQMMAHIADLMKIQQSVDEKGTNK